MSNFMINEHSVKGVLHIQNGKANKKSSQNLSSDGSDESKKQKKNLTQKMDEIE